MAQSAQQMQASTYDLVLDSSLVALVHASLVEAAGNGQAGLVTTPMYPMAPAITAASSLAEAGNHMCEFTPEQASMLGCTYIPDNQRSGMLTILNCRGTAAVMGCGVSVRMSQSPGMRERIKGACVSCLVVWMRSRTCMCRQCMHPVMLLTRCCRAK